MPDLKFFAHFPFCAEARAWAKEKGIKLDAQAIKMGEERLRQGLSEGRIREGASEMSGELEAQIKDYAASRAILAAWQNHYAQRRMAVAESKSASDFLRSSTAKTQNYPSMLAKSLGIDISLAKDDGSHGRSGFLIPFHHYLLYTPRDIHFKLVNMDLKNGFVKISEQQKVRILEEAVRKHLEDSRLPPLKNPQKEITEAISRLAPILPKENIEPLKIDQKDFPPCIKRLVDNLRSSQNVPHSGRVSLAIYLVKAGLSDEQIISLFSSAPDFSRETTAYQVAYVRKKGYSMPSCQTMDTYGICIAECRCFNPTKYRAALHEKFATASMIKSGEQKEEEISK